MTNDHIVDTDKMVPLTIEQLRKMDGKPVWIENISVPKRSKWAVLEYTDVENVICFTDDTYKLVSGYGKTWLAHAYQHAHIDRDVWTAEWVDEDIGEAMMCRCSKCGYPVSYFWGKTDFCPGCGKAMTPEAWNELENRLGVMV